MTRTQRLWTTALLLAGWGTGASGQTRVDLRTQVKNIDFSEAESTKPAKTGTELPATCSVGEQFFKTDAVAGQNEYGCTAPNTWTQLGAGTKLPGQFGNDFATTATATALTTLPGARVFGSALVASSTCTYTITGGSLNGIAFEYFTDSGQVVLSHPAGSGSLILSVSGTNCQAATATAPGWPTGMNFHPIATVVIANGQWGAVTPYPSLSGGWYVVCAANLNCTYSNGSAVVDVGANVMLSGAANTVTGSVDLSNAQFLNVPRGASDPTQCQGGVGALFYNTTSGVLKTCTNANPATWNAIAGAGLTGSWNSYNKLAVTQGPGTVGDSGVALPAGDVVGTTDAQPLANKTLLNPSLGPSASALTIRAANDGTAGTAANRVAKYAGSNAATAVTAAADNAIGICVSGCGTAGEAEIAISGTAPCNFTGAATAGDWVQFDSSGNCVDAGAAQPSSGSLVLGTVADGGGPGLHGVHLRFLNAAQPSDDPAVMRTEAANVVTGSIDLAGAMFLNIPRGATDPGECAGGVGSLFYNTTSGVLKACTGANPAVWTPMSGNGNLVGNWTSSNKVAVTQGPGAAADSGKDLPEGDLVGTTAAQTLANKTLTEPAINGSIMTGTHTVTGSVDMSAAAGMRLPNFAADPATCMPGAKYFNTTTKRERVCAYANTWGDTASGSPTAVLRDQVNTYIGGGLQDFSAALVRLPNASGFSPGGAAQVGYDNTTRRYLAGGDFGVSGAFPRVVYAEVPAQDTICANSADCNGFGRVGGASYNAPFNTAFQIPANYLTAGKILRITALMSTTLSSSAPASAMGFTHKVGAGSWVQTIGYNPIGMSGPKTNALGTSQWMIVGTQAPAAAASVIVQNLLAGAPSSSQPAVVSTTWDTTQNITVTLCTGWGVATAGNWTTLRALIVEELN